MKDLPEKLEPGGPIEEKITSKLLNAMLAAIRRAQPPEQVKGGRLGTGPAGWTLEIDPGRRVSQAIYPFQVVDKTDAEGAKVSIRSGSANGVTPAEIDHEDIEDSTLYDLSDGQNNIFLKLTVGADLGLSVAEIEISDSFPPNTTAVGYDRIAAVYVVDDAVVAINQYVRANVSYVYGGDSIHLFFK